MREFVNVQVEAWMPRSYVRAGEERQTKKLFPMWLGLGRFPVLFRDRKIILVRQFESNCLYSPAGEMHLAGYRLDHPKAVKIPKRHGRWRIDPESIKKLRGRNA